MPVLGSCLQDKAALGTTPRLGLEQQNEKLTAMSPGLQCLRAFLQLDYSCTAETAYLWTLKEV